MYVTDSVMLPISYVIKNSTSVDYKQTTANFRRIFYIRYRPLEIKSERGKPNLENHLHRGTLSRFTLHRNLCIMEFYNMLNDRKSKSRTPGLL